MKSLLLLAALTAGLAAAAPLAFPAARHQADPSCTELREVAARRDDASRMSGGSSTAGYHGIRYGGAIVTGPDGLPGWEGDPEVVEVFCGSPAHAAGLRAGDKLLTVNGRSSREPRVLTPSRPGMVFHIRALRGKEVLEFTIRSVQPPPEAR